MKKFKRKIKKTVYGAAFIGLIVGGYMAIRSSSVSAACGIASELGRVTSTVTVNQTGSYKLWVRLKPSSASDNAAYVQVDAGSCFKLGDNPALAPGAWTWVNYGQTGATQAPATFNLSSGSHSLVFIGNEASVQLDRILLLPSTSTCIPSNQRGSSEPGNNCLESSPASSTPVQPAGTGSAAPVVATTKDGHPITAVANNSIVSGNIVLDASVATDSSIARVEYYYGNKLLYTSTLLPFHLDTSVLDDGTYEITEKAIYKDGHVEQLTSRITINNHGSKTTASRSTAKKIALGIGIVLLLLGGLGLAVLINPRLRLYVRRQIARFTGRAIHF